MSFSLPFWSPAHADAILFDWDGIIAETRLDFSGIREKYYGARRAMLLEDARTLAPESRAGLMRDLEELEMRGARDAHPVPGISEVLGWVRSHKIPWAVVSRNCRGSIMEAARNIAVELPRVVRSRDDGTSVKPDPAALLETCRELGVPPSRTLLLGDYIYDMIGARRAGMRGALVRKRSEPDWEPWLELSYSSMDELYRELVSPSDITPWEYQEVCRGHGREFLRFAHKTALRLPADPAPDICAWLVRAASLGVGAFVVPDAELSPESWRKNQSFDPACMGLRLQDAIRSFLEVRYPFASVLGDGGRGVDAPEDARELEAFMTGLADGGRACG
ncbi:MAG: HAD-IA family hydrolase [Synergistaceae bacterium]|jgi:HAD superfamily hydrolase (TIGR01509 family)|nr:HAD-IA family hydrolase [Synergistaceae bacterium]